MHVHRKTKNVDRCYITMLYLVIEAALQPVKNSKNGGSNMAKVKAEVTVRDTTARLTVTESEVDLQVTARVRNGWWTTYYTIYKDNKGNGKVSIDNDVNTPDGFVNKVGFARISADKFDFVRNEVLTMIGDDEDYDEVDVAEAAREIINVSLGACNLTDEELRGPYSIVTI